MSRKLTIAMIVVFGAIAVGSGSARADEKNDLKKFDLKKLAEKLAHNKNDKDSSKFHMGGSLTGPKGTPENPGNNSSTKWHMGGSSTGPKGTPENPYSKDDCHDKCHDSCHDHDGDHCDHDPKFPVIDPGKGNGKPDDRVPVEPTHVTKDGFVWVNNHWERVKAGQTNTVVDPTLTGPTVRDHRTLTTGGFNGVVRDHRGSTSNAPGGVTVTTTPNGNRKQTIPTLSGPGPIDALGNGLSALGSAVKDVLTTTMGDDSNVHDHRTSNFSGNVRDHRN